MKKFKFEEEDISRVYDEVERRLEIDVSDLYEDGISGKELNRIITETRLAMLQGVYSTLMTLSADWPDVVQKIGKEENERWPSAFEE